MKKLILLILLFMTTSAQASTAWVVVKKTVVRVNPTYLSAKVIPVHYKDEVDVISVKGDWSRVKAKKAEGWLHNSAISDSFTIDAKEIDKSKSKSRSSSVFGDFDTSDSGSNRMAMRGGDVDDITLAGKGFNKDVENMYMNNNASLNYAAVDVMEAQSEIDFDLSTFAEQGGLDYVAERPVTEAKKGFGGFSLPGGFLE